MYEPWSKARPFRKHSVGLPTPFTLRLYRFFPACCTILRMNDRSSQGTALITGATSGIGRAFAVALGRRGYRLIVTGRRREKLESLIEEIEGGAAVANVGTAAGAGTSGAGTTDTATAAESEKPRVEILTGDLRDGATRAAVVKRIGECGDLRILIHNAGYGHESGFFDLSPEDLRGMGEVHMQCAVELVRAAVPMMSVIGDHRHGPGAADKGPKHGTDSAPTVILVSSLAAFSPAPGPAMYTATKRFLVAFGRAVHPELARRNIKTQVLCPGFTHTDFHDRLHWSAESRRSRGVVRWMSAEEVVRRSLQAVDRRHPMADPVYVPGATNRLLRFLIRLLPYRLYARLVQRRG